MSDNSKYTERESMPIAQPSGDFLPFSDGFLPFPFRGRCRLSNTFVQCGLILSWLIWSAVAGRRWIWR